MPLYSGSDGKSQQVIQCGTIRTPSDTQHTSKSNSSTKQQGMQ
jgi:hypothetical protein